jgi:hypothetical protein
MYGPPPNQYAPPGQGYAPYAQPMYGAGTINVTGARVLAIITVVLACLPGGIVALMMARQAQMLAQQGRMDEARSKLRISYIISGVSIALGVPFSILYIMSR